MPPRVTCCRGYACSPRANGCQLRLATNTSSSSMRAARARSVATRNVRNRFPQPPPPPVRAGIPSRVRGCPESGGLSPPEHLLSALAHGGAPSVGDTISGHERSRA